jgi:acetyl esterase/lipase
MEAALPGHHRGRRRRLSRQAPAAAIEKELHPYGPDPSQYAELYLPRPRTRHTAVVIIHGGYWRAAYGAKLGEPLARDLAARGWLCWNLEYRRAGNGGGWPQTFEDVAAGIDALAAAAAGRGLALDRVAALGHSAGGQLAVWAAGRHRLPPGIPGSAPALRLDAVLSQSGVLDLRRARELGLSDGAVDNFLGAEPGRHRLADPLSHVPLDVPVYAFHGTGDDVVPVELAEAYVAADRAAGGQAELIMVPGDHFALIDPGSAAMAAVRDVLARLG